VTKIDEAPAINTRQLCFLLAFLFPVARFLEAPRLFAVAAKGDLLVSALVASLVEILPVAAFLFISSKTDKTLFQLVEGAFGKWAARIFSLILCAYFLFAAVPPLFDAEKFSYAAFFDTAPTVFSFAPFFIFSAFLCTKNVKAIGRSADLCLFLFLFPFLGLIVMSVGESDFSSLLPIFSQPFTHSLQGVVSTKAHFSCGALLLPLLGRYRYEKGAVKKVSIAYGASVLFTLLFLAVFYGIYTTLAAREHYAFAKIAQYFPALTVVGRWDMLLVYLLTVVYAFYVCLPLQLAVDCFCQGTLLQQKTLFSALLNLAAFLFVLFLNQHYDAVYGLFTSTLSPVFFLFSDLLPLFLPLLLLHKRVKAGAR